MKFVAASLGLLAVSVVPALARAQVTSAPEVTPAQRYANGSVSVVGGLDLGLRMDSGGLGLNVGVLAGPRVVLPGGWTLQAQAGVGVSHFDSARAGSGIQGSYTAVQYSGGAAVGHAFVLAPTVAITPMLGYGIHGTVLADAPTGFDPGPPLHSVVATLPLTLFVSRAVYIEPSVSARVTFVPWGASTSIAWHPALNVGVVL